MSCMEVSAGCLAITNGLIIDCYDFYKHHIVTMPTSTKPQENDYISDVSISSDGKYLAAVTSLSKQLTVFELPLLNNHKIFLLPRSASKIRFTVNSEQILVADKSGDVLIYDFKNSTVDGTKLLGHLSLLLDILQTHDEKYIITSDRDEKIRVTNYPNTYSIQTYCLGHKEFVNHIELLPHERNYLVSASGDGTIKIWSYIDGRLCYTINTNSDVSGTNLKENFIKAMNEDGIEVDSLPIVHFAITQISETCSLLLVGVHTCSSLLVYRLDLEKQHFKHDLIEKLKVDQFPTALKLHKSALYIYDDEKKCTKIFKIRYENNKTQIMYDQSIAVFEGALINSDKKDNSESIKVLYKRKYDNVQEYQERKKQRLEKAS